MKRRKTIASQEEQRQNWMNSLGWSICSSSHRHFSNKKKLPVALLWLNHSTYWQLLTACSTRKIRREIELQNVTFICTRRVLLNRKVKSIDAFIGFHYLDLQRFEATGNEITVPVTKIMIHDEFDPETLVGWVISLSAWQLNEEPSGILFQANDIAVLQLYQPVKFSDQVHSICLPDGKIKRPANGAQMTIAGWGITLAFGKQKSHSYFTITKQFGLILLFFLKVRVFCHRCFYPQLFRW